MLRYPRIAAAVFFALLAIGFVALWVRSYFNVDRLDVSLSDQSYYIVRSYTGSLWYGWASRNDGPATWRLTSFPAFQLREWSVEPPPWHGFEFGRTGTGSLAVVVPHWFLAACSFGLAALFAFKRNWRFTVRGLLIATTLVAALFGLAAYSLR